MKPSIPLSHSSKTDRGRIEATLLYAGGTTAQSLTATLYLNPSRHLRAPFPMRPSMAKVLAPLTWVGSTACLSPRANVYDQKPSCRKGCQGHLYGPLLKFGTGRSCPQFLFARCNKRSNTYLRCPVKPLRFLRLPPTPIGFCFSFCNTNLSFLLDWSRQLMKARSAKGPRAS